MIMVPLGDLMASRVPSLDPSKYPKEVFELWSIPAFDTGQPEITEGANIGSSKKCVEPNDVLLSRIVPHIRRAWVVSKSQNEMRQLASSEWIVFRDESFYPDYLRHALTSDSFHARFMQTVAGVGGSLLRARPDGVKKIKIPLPPLEEQRRIAAILDKADGVRRKRKEAIRLTEELLKSTFLEMFGDPVTNPKGWRKISLGELLAEPLQNGAYFPKERYVEAPDGVEMVHMSDAFYNFVERGNLKRVQVTSEEFEKYKLIPNDVLIARRSLNYEGSAKPCLISETAQPLMALRYPLC